MASQGQHQPCSPLSEELPTPVHHTGVLGTITLPCCSRSLVSLSSFHTRGVAALSAQPEVTPGTVSEHCWMQSFLTTSPGEERLGHLLRGPYRTSPEEGTSDAGHKLTLPHLASEVKGVGHRLPHQPTAHSEGEKNPGNESFAYCLSGTFRLGTLTQTFTRSHTKPILQMGKQGSQMAHSLPKTACKGRGDSGP
jgi:hypothetical protein